MEALIQESKVIMPQLPSGSQPTDIDWDLESNKQIWSDAMFRIIGLEPQSFEPNKRKFVATLHPDDKERVLGAIHDAVWGSDSFCLVYRIVRPDGSERVVQCRAEVARSDAGRPLRVAATALDVTNLDVPKAQQAIAESHSHLSQSSPGAKTILVVDDEEAIMRMHRTILERAGYAVAAFTDSVKALEFFGANPELFDLVVTDQSMPNMTGYQIAYQIRTLRADIPIILCTGDDEVSGCMDDGTVGISAVLYKPFAPGKLRELVQNILNENSSQRANHEDSENSD